MTRHPIFLSVTTPHTAGQERFVQLLEAALATVGLAAMTLGRNQWSQQAPLVPIRRLMLQCQGTITLALVRSLVQGIDYPHGQPQPFPQRYLATAWTQIETAMAFQLGQPILVLRQEEVAAEGLLNPASSGMDVLAFPLNETAPTLPSALLAALPGFAARVAAFAALPPESRMRYPGEGGESTA